MSSNEAVGLSAAELAQYRDAGYVIRRGLFDGADLRALVSQNTDAKTIKRRAMEKGMHTLRGDGAHKVLTGVTSIAEVLRATEDEGVVAQI